MNTLVKTRRTQISPEPRSTCLADERRARPRKTYPPAAGEKRDGCFAMVLELPRAKGENERKRDKARGERVSRRAAGGGKVPPNVLEVSQKENSDVGWDPGSKCIT